MTDFFYLKMGYCYLVTDFFFLKMGYCYFVLLSYLTTCYFISAYYYIFIAAVKVSIEGKISVLRQTYF